MTEYLKTVVMLGIDPMMKRRERNRKKSNPLEVETVLGNGNEEESSEENENIGLMDKSFMHEEDLETKGDRDVAYLTLDIRIQDILQK